MSVQDILFLSISLSSVLSPFHLHSVFLSVPFSPSLTFRYIYSTCAQLFLSPHRTFCIFFLSFHPIPASSLLVAPSKSPHHFPFSCTLLPRYLLRNFLCHTSLILSIVSGFFDSFSSLLLVCSTFIHLPFALNLSTSSLVYPFL
jgi:hypothetical protein